MWSRMYQLIEQTKLYQVLQKLAQKSQQEGILPKSNSIPLINNIFMG